MSRRRPDPARALAYRVLRAVSAKGAYANLELSSAMAEASLDARDAAFATELVSGTSRLRGTYDRIIAAASGRPVARFQHDLLDVLRIGAHQVLSMRVAPHAAVGATVDLAALQVGERVAGLTNAVLRKVAARTLDEWVAELSRTEDALGALATRTHHPRWIAEAFVDRLGDEAEAALVADNDSPQVHLSVRPGLAEAAELGGEPGRWSPYAAHVAGNPAAVVAVREGRAGVQDEGSQVVAAALARVDAPSGPWLDLCAGPGGKAALLAGLARQAGETLLASELQPHRATLVALALRAYPAPHRPVVITADGTRPAWRPGRFARVMADVPCSGLGALRRRPESRWTRDAASVEQLHPLQVALLRSALDAAADGGVVAYVTCSPHRRETVDVVTEVLAHLPTGVEADLLDAPAQLPGVPEAASGRFVQLWPHRHGTDAMFAALIRVRRAAPR